MMRRIARAVIAALVLAPTFVVGGAAQTVMADPLPGTIEGHVTGPDDQALVGAVVVLYAGGGATGGGYITTTMTDQDGRYQFSVSPGDYSVSTTYDGLTFVAPGTVVPAEYRTISVAEGATVDAPIAIPAAGLVAGRVTDGTVGIGGAAVVVPAATPFMPDRTVATTDVNGHFVTGPIYEPNVVLRFDPPIGSGLSGAYHPGVGNRAAAQPVVVVPGATTNIADIVLTQPGSISGTVTGIDGNPTRAVVRLWDAATTFDQPATSQPVGFVETTDGSYSFTGIPVGEYIVAIAPWWDEPVPFAVTYHADGGEAIEWGAATPVSLTSGGSLVVNVRAQIGRQIEGVVTDHLGNELGGVEVNASGDGTDPRIEWRSTYTEPDGSYTLSGLAPGPLRLYAAASGGTPWLLGEYYLDDYTEPDSLGVVVPSNGPATVADFTLDRGIGGSIALIDDGGPVVPDTFTFHQPMVCVAPAIPVAGQSCSPINVMTSHSPSGFHLGGLHPNTYNIADATWSGVGDVETFTIAAGQRVDCQLAVPGASAASSCVVSAAPAGASISGLVTDPYGQPMAGAVVHVHDSEAGYLPVGGYTLSDGSYTITDVPPGTYRLQVSEPYRVGAFQPTLAEWWAPTGDAYENDYSNAADVVITGLDTVTGVDVQLDLPASGVVTVAGGSIVQPALVGCPGTTTYANGGCVDGGGGVVGATFYAMHDDAGVVSYLVPGPYTFVVLDGNPFFGGVVATESVTVTIPASHTFACTLPLAGQGEADCELTPIVIVDDDDGVDDTEENGAPNGGDGDGDGTPDNEQASVASLEDPTIDDADGDGSNYVTIRASSHDGGPLTPAPLKHVTLLQPTSAPPPGVTPQSSLLGFEVAELAEGATAVVRVFLPQPADSYYKYDADSDAWTEATSLAQFDTTPTTIGGVDRWGVTLTIVDGGFGDDDGAIDGSVTDPGVFGLTERVPPTVVLASVATGDELIVGSTPSIECITTDDGSGVAVHASLTIEPVGVVHPDGVGTYTARCEGAVDQAGNVAGPVTATYRVFYGMTDEVFTGGSAVASPAVNEGKAGRTYPLRWELRRGDGSLVGDLAAVTSWAVYPVDCDFVDGPIEQLPETAITASTTLSVSGGQFRLNYKTDKSAGCSVLVVSLVDGNSIVARFRLR